MPIHDWNRIGVSIFHAFLHGWITEIVRALNQKVLPSNYYALPEQHTASFGQEELTAQEQDGSDPESEMAFYRRKQNTVTVRHVSGDRIVAMVEIVSPGNKAARNPLRVCRKGR